MPYYVNISGDIGIVNIFPKMADPGAFILTGKNKQVYIRRCNHGIFGRRAEQIAAHTRVAEVLGKQPDDDVVLFISDIFI